MSDAELRAAAAQMLADLKSRSGGLNWSYGGRKAFDVIEDVLSIYVADNPAADDEPITAHWLESLGFARQPSAALGLYLDDDPGDEDVPRRVLCVSCDGVEIADANDIDRCSVSLCDWTTRGEVRRLLAALGVCTKESATDAD